MLSSILPITGCLVCCNNLHVLMMLQLISTRLFKYLTLKVTSTFIQGLAYICNLLKVSNNGNFMVILLNKNKNVKEHFLQEHYRLKSVFSNYNSHREILLTCCLLSILVIFYEMAICGATFQHDATEITFLQIH